MMSRDLDPARWEIGTLIDSIGKLDETARAAAMAILAHSLTVEIRALLVDPPFSDAVIARVRQINETLHHLTSRLNPHHDRSSDDDLSLLSALAEDAARCGLHAAMKRGLVIAVRNSLTRARKPIAAK
jgi:hypothetical protein